MSNVVSSFWNNEDTSVYDNGTRLLIGQIDKVHYVDDKTNQSERFVEYDVSAKDAYGGQTVFENVRIMSKTSSTNDYDETVLEPSLHAFAGELDETNFFENKNGTHVILAFLQGSIEKPFILGTLPHPKIFEEAKAIAYKAATIEDGVRKKGEFRGFQYEIDKEGQITFTYRGSRKAEGVFERPETAPTKVNIDNTGKLLVHDKEKQLLELDRVTKTISIEQYNDVIKTEEGVDSDPKDKPEENLINSIKFDKTAKTITTLTAKDVNSIVNDGTNQKITTITGTDTNTVVNDGAVESITMTFKSGLVVTIDGAGDNVNIATNGGLTIDVDGPSDLVTTATSGGLVTIVDGSSDVMDIVTSAGTSVTVDGSADQVIAETSSGDKIDMTPGTIEIEENGGGKLKLSSGKVALGNGTEVVDILSQTLNLLNTDLGNLGYPLVNSAAYAALKASLDAIKGTL